MQTVPEQVIVVGLEPDLRALIHQLAVLQQLAGMGQAVLVAARVFAPRIAEVDVDAVHPVGRGEGIAQALDVDAGDLDVIRGHAALGIGGLDLALGQDQHLVGDVDAQVVDVRVPGGQLRQETALATAQLQVPGLVGAGVGLVPVAAVGQRLVHMEVAGQQFGAGIGFKTHSHGSVSCYNNVESFSRTTSGVRPGWARLPWQKAGLPPPRPAKASFSALPRARASVPSGAASA